MIEVLLAKPAMIFPIIASATLVSARHRSLDNARQRA